MNDPMKALTYFLIFFSISLKDVVGQSDCLQVDEVERIIKSPYYPSNYGDNTYCSRILKKSGSFHDSSIIITFEDFETEHNDGCSFDFVKIFDGGSQQGRLLGHFCGSSLPDSLKSSLNAVMVVFKTDASVTKKGFKLSYTNEDQYCFDHFNERRRVIETPNFGFKNYKDLINCFWTIRNCKYCEISVSISSILTQSEDCNTDYLEILSKSGKTETSLGKYCGRRSDIPAVHVKGDAAIIKFRSDKSLSSKGFSLTWQEIGCVYNLTSDSGAFHSSIDRYNVCVWYIRVSDNSSVQLTVENFDFHTSALCSGEVLEVFDADSDDFLPVGHICYHGNNVKLTSTSNVMTVKLQSYQWLKGTFTATYRKVPECDAAYLNLDTPSQEEFNITTVSFTVVTHNTPDALVTNKSDTSKTFTIGTTPETTSESSFTWVATGSPENVSSVTVSSEANDLYNFSVQDPGSTSTMDGNFVTTMETNSYDIREHDSISQHDTVYSDKAFSSHSIQTGMVICCILFLMKFNN